MVHTVHPETGKTNVGMYRMQVLDKNTTAMHWQRHKTGANHFEAWKKSGKRMPVSVALGGDPVYTYSATAPLPENINEYILAGFLRGRKVKLVKCITNDLYVPYDADIIIEGYVDPAEELVWEGPFGDHTGFYSLADWYPKFHVTCITHSRKCCLSGYNCRNSSSGRCMAGKSNRKDLSFSCKNGHTAGNYRFSYA